LLLTEKLTTSLVKVELPADLLSNIRLTIVRYVFYRSDMDYAAAIDCHRQPLIRIVATLYAMIGFAEGGVVERLSRPVYRKALSLLKPAEWAVRRLIVIAAHGLVVAPHTACTTAEKPTATGKSTAKSKRKRRRAFSLFDPLARYGFNFRRRRIYPKAEPRIRSFDTPTGVVVYRNGFLLAPLAPPPKPDGSVNGQALCRRLEALKRALEDLSGQAKRYARLRAKTMAERAPKRDMLRRLPPSKPHRKPRHEVHDILEECDWLARTLSKPDTS
jgi:hypothetical protein